jgi:tetratricopeptide (TPR) repeat protein
MLIVMVIGLIPAFALTGAFVRADRRHLEAEAAGWRARGDRELARHSPDAAVDAYRTALARGDGGADVRLKLADALIAAGRTTEAESHLRTLWAEAPGRGVVNLALARLAVRAGRMDDAIRYYHAAIDGSWERDPAQSRRDASFELARVLLDHHDPTGARAELILLADSVSADPDRTLQVARMLVEADDARTALALARRALTIRPDDVAALMLAAGIEFRNANYAETLTLLRHAARTGALPANAEAELRDATDVLALDPLTPRLGSATRQQRLRRVLMIARERLDVCVMAAGATVPADLQALDERLRGVEHSVATARRTDADDLDEAIAVVADVERLSDTACGPLSPNDRTVRLMLKAHPDT